MAVRLPPKWMKSIDNRLLEILDEGGTHSPKTIEDDGRVPYTREYIGRRLRLLTKASLVERVGRGMYRITGEGRQYLKGNKDLRDLKQPN